MISIWVKINKPNIKYVDGHEPVSISEQMHKLQSGISLSQPEEEKVRGAGGAAG